MISKTLHTLCTGGHRPGRDHRAAALAQPQPGWPLQRRGNRATGALAAPGAGIWPLPALAVWLACWALAWGLGGAFGVTFGGAFGAALAAAGPTVAWLAAAALGAIAAAAWPRLPAWRRVLMGLGFPASAAGLGLAPGLPGWAWLLPLGLLLLAYPLRAWRDAPLFPTPAAALQGLADCLPLAPGARVLDAGCGLGHGLRALRRQWPHAQLEGVEWSWPLALAARLRCRGARVRQGDMWRQPWAGCTVVYLFQRPESMARAWAKAQAEMPPGSWLVSLDFAVPDLAPQRRLEAADGRALWLYQVPPAALPDHRLADQPRRLTPLAAAA